MPSASVRAWLTMRTTSVVTAKCAVVTWMKTKPRAGFAFNCEGHKGLEQWDPRPVMNSACPFPPGLWIYLPAQANDDSYSVRRPRLGSGCLGRAGYFPLGFWPTDLFGDFLPAPHRS